MNISRGLEHFINEALVKNKRDRFVGFLSTTKGHAKFSKSLDHDFVSYLNKSKFTFKFSASVLEQTGDIYCSSGFTNNSEDSMANLYGKAPWEGGWLLLNKSGSIAIYRPEGRIDDELYIKL
jgi:hypothetical protein